RLVGGWIDQADIRRQRERHPNQAVLAQVSEISRRVAIGSEIIGVDRPEQRVVCLRIELATPSKELKSRLGTYRRELETVGGHVAVGTRASVAVQTVKAPSHERAAP